MEETVIWEQHTVTLHRVGIGAVCFLFFFFFLDQLLFLIAKLLCSVEP